MVTAYPIPLGSVLGLVLLPLRVHVFPLSLVVATNRSVASLAVSAVVLATLALSIAVVKPPEPSGSLELFNAVSDVVTEYPTPFGSVLGSVLFPLNVHVAPLFAVVPTSLSAANLAVLAFEVAVLAIPVAVLA